MLALFDYPDPNVHAEQRPVTNTSLQKLYMLNGPFLPRQADVLAARLAQARAGTQAERIERAYELLYGRAPAPEEIRLGLAFLDQPDPAAAWVRYAHVLFSANELLYVD
jgi:hypothetical protein